MELIGSLWYSQATWDMTLYIYIYNGFGDLVPRWYGICTLCGIQFVTVFKESQSLLRIVASVSIRTGTHFRHSRVNVA